MDEYNELYFTLFNTITGVIGELQTAQLETEELFISHGPERMPSLSIIPKDKGAD